MSWVMVVYVLATHQVRLERIEFKTEALCEKAIPKVESLSHGSYPIWGVCVQVRR